MSRRVLPILALSIMGAAAGVLTVTPELMAQDNPTEPLRLVIHADQGTDTISRHIYGHFAEHLGRDIYDGF